MTNNRNPSWRFAPTGGGYEQGDSPGQQHFANLPLQSMVRETIQNSLDNPEPGIQTVHVTFSLMDIDRRDIQADDLSQHIQASLEEAEKSRGPETVHRYRKMLETINQDRIPCLAIVDTESTGLKGDRWTNLILREGMPTVRAGKSTTGLAQLQHDLGADPALAPGWDDLTPEEKREIVARVLRDNPSWIDEQEIGNGACDFMPDEEITGRISGKPPSEAPEK